MPVDDHGDGLDYPERVLSRQERAAWLEHRRDRWNAWSQALDRIKQDEQRWVTVAMLFYGALVTVMHTGRKGLFPAGDDWVCFFALVAVVLVAYGFGYIWVGQALTLRVQYYRTMARLFTEQAALGDPAGIPAEWRGRDFEAWYKKATRPEESKLWEMWLLGLLMAATIVFAFILFARALSGEYTQDPVSAISSWWWWTRLLCLAFLSLLLPRLRYRDWDALRAISGLWTSLRVIRWGGEDRNRMADLFHGEHMRKLRNAMGKLPDAPPPEAEGSPGPDE